MRRIQLRQRETPAKRPSGPADSLRPPFAGPTPASSRHSTAVISASNHVHRLAAGRWKSWRKKADTARMCGKVLRVTEEIQEDENKRQYDSPLARFRHAVARVRFMCRVQINLNRFALEAGRGAFAAGITDLAEKISKGRQVTYVQDDGPRKETVTFNVADYQTKKEFHWPKKARLILSKDPQNRTDDDVRKICSLMRGLHSFRKYSRAMQNLISRVVRYQKYGRRRVVVRKGHPGFAFYFIFSGSACVTLDEDEETAFTKKEIVVLKKGVCFGEIALIKDVPRMATIVCIEDTEFLIVDRDDFFHNGIHHHIQQEFQYRLQFFRHSDLFSSWPKEKLAEISDMGRIEDYNHGSVIVNDSTDTQWLLFITKGRCDVLRLVDLAKLYADRIREKAAKVKKIKFEPSRSELLRGDYPLSLLPEGQRSPYPWLVPSILPGQSGTVERGSEGAETPNGGTDQEGEGADVKRVRPTSRGETPQTRKDFLPAGLQQQLNDEYSQRTRRVPGANLDSKFLERMTLSTGTIKAPGVEAGVYIRIDSLGPGQCFGIERIVTGEMPTLSLLSLGCEIIRVPCSRFKEHADEGTLGKLQGMMPHYPDNQFLWECYREQSTWNNFRSKTLRDVVTSYNQAVTPHTFPKSLRSGGGPLVVRDHVTSVARRQAIRQQGTDEESFLPRIDQQTSLLPPRSKITAVSDAEQTPFRGMAHDILGRPASSRTSRPKTAGRRTQKDHTLPSIQLSQQLTSDCESLGSLSFANRPQSVHYVSASRPPRPILHRRPASSVKEPVKVSLLEIRV